MHSIPESFQEAGQLERRVSELTLLGGGPTLWLSGLSQYLQHWHPLAVLLPTQLLANVLEKVKKDGLYLPCGRSEWSSKLPASKCSSPGFGGDTKSKYRKSVCLSLIFLPFLPLCSLFSPLWPCSDFQMDTCLFFLNRITWVEIWLKSQFTYTHMRVTEWESKH